MLRSIATGHNRLSVAPESTTPPNPSVWLAAALWIVSAGLAVWAAGTDPSIVAWFSFTTMGAYLVWMRPRHPAGWLLLVDGLVWTAGAAATHYVSSSSSVGASEALAAASFDLVGWILAVGLIPLTLLLVPTGRLMGRWDRIAATTIVAAGGCLAVIGLVVTGPLPSSPSIENPFNVSDLPGWVALLQPPAELAFALGVIGALAISIIRFLRSEGVLRQQLRWLAFSGSMMLVGFVVGDVLTLLGLPGESWANTLPMLTVPAAIGVAVLRDHLWDLDLVVRGTVVYGLVALGITTIYVGLVVGVGALADRAGAEDWLAILATALAAVLFQPIRLSVGAAINGVIAARRPAAPALMIRTLGGFRVERRGVPVALSEWRSRKARQLLKMLVARRGRPLHREQAIEILWPEADGEDLSNRLAVALSTLRSVLDPLKHHEADFYVSSADDVLMLRLEHVTVDLEAFMETAISAQTIGDMREADDLYRGDFLIEDLYEEWARPVRDEARVVFLGMLRNWADISQALEPTNAAHLRLRILELDPWDEDAHMALIRAWEEAGRHGEARRARKRYEDSMAQIGIAPRLN